ncbi:Fur family transcriptional regulator [Flectobacillus major]|uniref:Fur family transcriptional regulator n=1 Tax=Flectobacillus major TaxID=103 RepID=UPI00286DBFD7|nr:transcriptional repressor [Flectobacillus major]
MTQYLEIKGLRKTNERFTILEEIYNRDDHFEAEELFFSIKSKNFHVSRATIYNTLDILVECQLIKKHQFGNKISSRYEKAYGRRQHDHLVCIECQLVTEFCDPRIQVIQNLINDTFQCEVLYHSLTFYSKCLKENCIHRKNEEKK